jgi:hypothetical protein
MRYGHAIAMTMASALVTEPAWAQNSPAAASGGQGPYDQSAPPGHSSQYGPPPRGWVVSEPDIHNFSGPRIEVRVGWSDLTGPSAPVGGYGGYGAFGGYCGGYSCGSNQELSSNFTVGGEIGYDVPIARSFTVGPYGRFTTNISTSSGCLSCAGDDYSLGVRAGFMASHHFLVYGKIGYNNLHSSIKYSDINNSGVAYNGSTAFRYSGEEFGVGVNYIISKKTYIGLEFMDDSYGNGDPYYNANQRFDIGLSLGMHF